MLLDCHRTPPEGTAEGMLDEYIGTSSGGGVGASGRPIPPTAGTVCASISHSNSRRCSSVGARRRNICAMSLFLCREASL